MTNKGTGKAQLVQEILRTKFACGELLHGSLQEIATEVGLTRERVRVIAMDLGYVASRKSSQRRTRTCPLCEKETTTTDQVCRDCRNVTLPCGNPECDKMVEKSAKALAWKVSHGLYKGRVYCNRECWRIGHWQNIRAARELTIS